MTAVTAACQQLTGGPMLVVERTDRKERYGYTSSSASHPTLEAGAASCKSGVPLDKPAGLRVRTDGMWRHTMIELRDTDIPIRDRSQRYAEARQS